MSKKWQIAVILGLGLLSRFLFFGYPNETVFDEVHFGKFVSAYYTGEFYFDIHPALGKHLIAGFAKITGFKPEFDFAQIGSTFPNEQYINLRFLPSLAGSLLPLIVYLILLELGVAPLIAFAGGLFVILDNALLTESRYVLMDSFLLLFGFTSFLFYLRYRGTEKNKYMVLSGIFSGLAISIKWIGLSFIGLSLAYEGILVLKTFFKSGLRLLDIKNLTIKLTCLFIIPLFIYFIIFMIDFNLLTKSGTGDAFMSPSFQKTLSGSRYESDQNIERSGKLRKFFELNRVMYTANQGLTATHPYSSQWFTWPFMSRPIYYWVHSDPLATSGQTARIYLIGNPVIWWTTTAAVIFGLIYFISKLKTNTDTKFLLLFGGYALNILPFIGVKRVLFLYHYLTALIFSIIILFYLLNKKGDAKKIIWVLIATAFVVFVFFSPLNYGLELSPESYETRVWMESWR